MNGQGVYTGRFAPSPTGPLHFGSLVAALAGFLDARHHGGRWLLRIEDLDPPRESASAPAEIMAQLRAFGLIWDGDVLYQSTRGDAYRDALDFLERAGLTYPCTCSRGDVDRVYSGKCRHNIFAGQQGAYAVRVRVDDAVITLNDRIAGTSEWHLSRDVGDFIVKRRDGYFAYQLAVVVDDAFQGITHVVRGNDLLDSTPRQMYLAQCLGYAPMSFCHVPVIVDTSGDKLSKQNHAAPVETDAPLPVLRQALAALGQAGIAAATNVDTLLAAAIDAWDPAAIPRAAHVRLDDLQGS